MSAPLVTGVGCVCALGAGAEAVWAALTAGKSGLRPIEDFDTTGLRNHLAGRIVIDAGQRDFAAAEGIASRLELWAALAIGEALAGAGLTAASVAGRRTALVLGTSLGMSLSRPDIEATVPGGGGGDLSAFTARFAERYGLSGDALMVSTACASGTHAIALGRDLILHGGYDLVIAGGADTLDRMKYLGHSALNTLTPTRVRPCTAERDGTLLGEGAGIVVLEAAGTAGRRPPLARCLGAGYSTDINHITAPDPEGRGGELCMAEALRDAGLSPDAIDHVNLHGSGTALNDTAEALALGRLFGAERAAAIPATSIKPAVGHTMGAAGAIEAIATILALRDGMIPPTLNVEADRVALPVGLVCGAARRGRLRAAISNSFGFGGANGSLVFGA